MNNWYNILKMPMVPNNQLVKTLIQMQRANPDVFRESRNINNPLEMVDEMLDDLRSHSHYGAAEELESLKQSLLSIQQGFRRLEDLT